MVQVSVWDQPTRNVWRVFYKHAFLTLQQTYGKSNVASPSKKSFPLRIDPVLWAEIERLAAQELRSANAQVEYLLRQALQLRGRQLPKEDEAGKQG